MNPGAAGNALQKKKPDIIRLGLIDMINTQTLMLITLMKFVKLKTYLKAVLRFGALYYYDCIALNFNF